MYDTSSETDCQTHSSYGLDESCDSHLLTEARCDQLQEENASLIRQNNVLRAQFEQAVSISRNVSSLHKEIDDLKAKLFESNTERDDLKNRLEISVRAQEETNQKLLDEHARNAEQRKSDVSSMQQELNKLQRSYQTKLDKVYEANKSLQQEKDDNEIAQKTLVGQIDKVVLNASRFFGRNISTFDELCEIIEGEPIQQLNSTSESEQQTENSKCIEIKRNEDAKRLEEVQKRAKRMKCELKATMKKLSEAQSELQKGRRDAEGIVFKYEKEVRELKGQIYHVKEEKSLGDADRDHKISMLESKIEMMKEELAKKKSTSQVAVTPKIVEEKKPVLFAKKIEEKDENKFSRDDKFINEQLTARIEELTSQLKAATQEIESLKKIHEESERKINSIIISHESEHNELNALKTIHNDTISEVETLRAALHAKEEKIDKKEAKRRKKEQQKMKSVIAQLENSNEELKKQLFDVQLEAQSAEQQAMQEKDKALRTEAEKDALKEQVSKITLELGDAKQKLANIVPLTEEDFLPNNSWTNNDFEAPLAQQIAKISTNEVFHASSKLQQIYKAINRYFSKKIENLKEAEAETNEITQNMYSSINDFIVSLSIALNGKATQLEEFLQCSEIGNEIVNNVTELKTAINDLARSRDALQSIIENIGATFGITNCNDICAKMAQIRSEFDKQFKSNSKQLKKAKSVRNHFEELKIKYAEEKEERQKEVQRLKSSLESVNETNQGLTEANKKLKSDLATIKRNEIDLEEKIELLENKHNNEAEEINNSHNNQLQSVKKEYSETIDHLTNELAKANQTIAEADAHLHKYKSVVSSQKATILDSRVELQTTKQQLEIKLKKHIDRSNIEKKQLVENYEKAINELSQQCDKQNNDVLVLSTELSKKDKHLKDMKEIVNQLKRDKTRLEKEGRLREEEFQRENRIAQSALRGAAMSAESQYTAKLTEQKVKWEAEKRRILSYVADELRQFFNASDAIDEKSFRSVISKAKEEINRLQRTESAIRRMVGATGRQSTDDAVAQLVINTK